MKINYGTDLQKKSENLFRAYTEVKKKVEESLDGKEFYVEEPIDENYILIASFKNGEQYSIVDKEYNLQFCYFDEDDWTIGDLVGGYLDLYYEK